MNFYNKDILSDSDPDGDRLDIEDIIGKYINKNIKNKIIA